MPILTHAEATLTARMLEAYGSVLEALKKNAVQSGGA